MITVSVPKEVHFSDEEETELKNAVEAFHDRAKEGFYDEFDGTFVKEMPETQNDPVNHPEHYTYGTIECIDYITDKQFDFCLGNAIKYITRAGRKKDVIEDLRKAIWYIEKEIEVLQNE